jgi:hypothetical protein
VHTVCSTVDRQKIIKIQQNILCTKSSGDKSQVNFLHTNY